MDETTLRAVYRAIEAEMETYQLATEAIPDLTDAEYAVRTGHQNGLARAKVLVLNLSDY